HPIAGGFVHARILLRRKSLPRFDKDFGPMGSSDFEGAIRRSGIHHDDFTVVIAHQRHDARQRRGKILFFVLSDQNHREGHAWKDTSEPRRLKAGEVAREVRFVGTGKKPVPTWRRPISGWAVVAAGYR